VEKLAYVLWRRTDTDGAALRDALLAAASELAARGARALRVNVADEHVAAGGAVCVGRMEPKSAFVTFWLDDADARGPAEEVLAEHAARLAGFLVVESVPMRNTRHVVPAGQRTPGFNFVTCIEPKDGLPYADFLDHWHHEHRRVAVETQPTFAYVRNEIVRALTPDAPTWAAVVEESFPIEALTDPAVWYAAEGSPERLDENRRRMIGSCLAFLALDRVEAHPMSEYVVVPDAQTRLDPSP